MCIPPIVARQRFGIHVTAAQKTRWTRRFVWDQCRITGSRRLFLPRTSCLVFLWVPVWAVHVSVCIFVTFTTKLTSWNPFSEGGTCSATQEFPNILLNPKVYYRVHRSLYWSLSWVRSIQSIPLHYISLRYILILFNLLRRGLPSGIFTSGIPTNILPHSCYMPCPSHPPSLDHSNYTWRRVQVMNLWGTEDHKIN
jgi:hypothetical protein